jgi:uncharacterized protein (TIGR03435 family)
VRLTLIAAVGSVVATFATNAAPQSAASFDVVSIKRANGGPPTVAGTGPGTFYRPGTTVRGLLQDGYGMSAAQLIGLPEWATQQRFEVRAKAAAGTSSEQLQLMIQTMLAERFRVVSHREQRTMRHAELVRARFDGQLGKGLERCADPENLAPAKPVRMPLGGAPFFGRCQSTTGLLRSVSNVLQDPVVNRAGLDGLWTYQFFFALQALGAGAALNAGDDLPGFVVALEEQLGLKVRYVNAPIDVLVIDEVRPPTEN